MTIKELEERTGMPRANIRYYEEQELIFPQRLPNGYRDYSEEDANTLEKIKLLRQLHLDIDTIRMVQQGTLTLEQALFNPLGELTVPAAQRNFATKENLPTYPEKIAALKSEGAKLVLVYGIGRMCHIAFWEPTFAADYATAEEWEKAPYRIGAKIHPLTVEQNALTSFKSRTTLVPCRANTIGPGLFLQADYAIGGADGTLGRGLQWQGMSLWMTLRYGKTPWITSSYIPTLAGRLFFLKELAGPLVAECN